MSKLIQDVSVCPTPSPVSGSEIQDVSVQLATCDRLSCVY